MKDKQFLFVITYGRSGSTLLNGILNSIPNYRIIGENFDAYNDLMIFYNKMLSARDSNKVCENNFNISGDQNPWHNEFSEKQLQKDIQTMATHLMDPYDTAKVIGFKEIRYPDHKNLSEYLSWLYYIFNCRFIFLTRNLDDVSISEWHKNNPKCKETLQTFESKIKEHILNNLKQPWFHITYEDITKNRLEDLFKFLGEKYDVEKVQHILATPHGYKTNGKIKICGVQHD